MVRIASFDIGRCNFAQYIEDISDYNVISSLKERYNLLPKKEQRRVKGEMNENISDILNKVALSGKRVSTGVYNLTSEDNSELNRNTRLALIQHLRRFQELWQTCDIFVIEQQFFNSGGFGKARKAGSGANVDAIKIAESTYMWFLDKYPEKEICYFGSQFKTQIFGAPWEMTKIQRKNWAIEKSKEIYNDRNDIEMNTIFNLSEAVKRKRITTDKRIEEFKIKYKVETEDLNELSDKIIRNKQKLDDISDAMLQCQAYKYRVMVACF